MIVRENFDEEYFLGIFLLRTNEDNTLSEHCLRGEKIIYRYRVAISSSSSFVDKLIIELSFAQVITFLNQSTADRRAGL